VKTCAARRVVGGPQAAVMRCNDGTADGQSQTGSVNLRGKKRIVVAMLVTGGGFYVISRQSGSPLRLAGTARAHRKWSVSKVALWMYLDGDRKALRVYHSGDRTGVVVKSYFERAGL
jgi:hypothetical protein